MYYVFSPVSIIITFTNLQNTFNASIVFLTFFCCHESAVLSTGTKTDEMRPNYSARPFRSFLFLTDAFTKEWKISIACSRWWFDRLTSLFLSGELSAPLISLSAPSLFSLSRSLEAGRRYRRSGFIKLSPNLASHSSKVLVKNY